MPVRQYPEFMNKAIYTSNVIEASNGQVRKGSKTKVSFPNDDAVYKIVFLALQKAQKKWTMPIKGMAACLKPILSLFAK
jgi:transposase-like protein